MFLSVSLSLSSFTPALRQLWLEGNKELGNYRAMVISLTRNVRGMRFHTMCTFMQTHSRLFQILCLLRLGVITALFFSGDNRAQGLVSLDDKVITIEERVAAIMAFNKKENPDQLRCVSCVCMWCKYA